jgi:hypothetical protein
MRHLLILFGAAVLMAALVAGPGPSNAAPVPALKHAEQNNAVETVGYYRRRWRRGYPYWGPRAWGPRPYWGRGYGYWGGPRPYYGWGGWGPYRRGWGWGGWRGGYW